MSDESLIAPKNPDGFTTESPIRAFTDFKTEDLYAIGKGFRPSLAHMAAYMSAMESKERWQLIQVILPRDNDGEPTMLFRKVLPPMHVLPPMPDDIYTRLTGEIFRDAGITTEREARSSEALATAYGFQHTKDLPVRSIQTREVRDRTSPSGVRTEALPPEHDFNRRVDDPIHPKHYDGNACAEIIEHMPTNVGLAGKYIWRLGEKDAVAQEIGKLIFYLKRQHTLATGKHAGFGRVRFGFSDPEKAVIYQAYCMERINERFGKNEFDVDRAAAMTNLVQYTMSGRVDFLKSAIALMESLLKAYGIETGTGLAV